jgi:sec-independent protein translocase protein TatA
MCRVAQSPGEINEKSYIVNNQIVNTFMLGTWEIILIALVILLIFGGKKIPELMKGIGKGMRSFREGVEGKEDKENNDEKEEAGNER